MNIQSSYPNNLIDYDKHNYRKYKQVVANDNRNFQNKPPEIKQLHSILQQSRSILLDKTSNSTPKTHTHNVKFALVKKNSTNLQSNNDNDYYYSNSHYSSKPYHHSNHNHSTTSSSCSCSSNSSSISSSSSSSSCSKTRLNKEKNTHVDAKNRQQCLLESNNAASTGCCPFHYSSLAKKTENVCTNQYRQQNEIMKCASQALLSNCKNKAKAIDLSGYLIFVTTSHHGDEVKVYG